MDSTDSTVSPQRAAQRRATHATRLYRDILLVVCGWSALVLLVFLIGWARAPSTHSEVARPAVTEAGPPAPQRLSQETSECRESITLLNHSISVDDLEGIGDLPGELPPERLPEPTAEPAPPRDIPESRRWQIQFPEGTTETEYARQLTALGVELGVVRPDGTIEYLEKPGAADSRRRTGTRADETRIYWTWNSGNLVKADKALLKNAHIDAGEDLILHLWPPATAERLARLELEYKGRKPSDIFVTRFAIKRSRQGYELYVQEQIGR